MTVQSLTILIDEKLLPAKKLIAGKISCIYEKGSIRYLRYGNIEVIRMIYFAVRDENWHTPVPTLSTESVQYNEHGFSISYTSHHNLSHISYRSEVVIEAVDNQLMVRVRGEALSSFNRNRIGICVLHPLDYLSGNAITIETPDGVMYDSLFPSLVEPHQPFLDVQKMHFEIAGIKAELAFEGDIFETEDQRNWSDSSYKTYSTPLSRPMPVQVNTGDKIEQKLLLTLGGKASPTNNREKNDAVTKLKFPEIGYACEDNHYLGDSEIEILTQIPFDHYRVTLQLSDPDWSKKFVTRVTEASKLKSKLELVLLFEDEFVTQLDSVINLVRENSSLITRILPLTISAVVTPTSLLKSLYSRIKTNNPDIEVGYGTRGYFADLNRNRPTDVEFDFASFGLTPQVHLTDSRTLIDNLACQSDLIETIKAFAPGKKISVAPIIFKMPNSSLDESGMPVDYDPRQHSNFGALWTLATIRNLTGASALCLYQTTGYKGMVPRDRGNNPTELYNTMKTIKSFNPKWIIGNNSQSSLHDKIILENESGNQMEIVAAFKDRDGFMLA